MTPSPVMLLRRALLCFCAGWLLGPGALSAQEAEPEQRRVPARVKYLVEGTVYLDQGRRAGVQVGDTLLLPLRDGGEERLRVSAVAERSCSASFPTPLSLRVVPGSTATLLVRRPQDTGGDQPAQAQAPDSTLWDEAEPEWEDAESGPLQPLLAPVSTEEAARAREERDAFLLDGRVTLSAFHTKDEEVDRDWTRLRAYADLEVSRLAGTDWRAVIRLSANAQYENSESDSHQLRMHELYFEHSPERQPHRLRLGRFFFEPLPTVGQLDGIQGEVRMGTSPVRVGVAGGFLPTAKREAPDGQRAGGVIYASVRTDPLASTGVDATFGYFGSVDDSHFDRSAFMGRQLARFADRVYLTLGQVVDVYDTDDYRSGVRLTRAYADLRVRIVRALSVGAGYDRNELPDTISSRTYYFGLLRPANTRSQRIYGYASQSIQPGWSFSQRVSLIERRNRKDQTGVTLTFAKVGIFAPGDSVRAGYYGLFGGETESHSPYLELTKALSGSLSVWGRYRLLLIEPPLGDDLTQHELGLGVTWVVGDLFLQADGSYTTGDDVSRYRGYLSLTWRF